MNKYQWRFVENKEYTGQADLAVLHPIAARILANHGLNNDNMAAFLRPSYEQGLHSPLLFSDLSKAIERLWWAKEHNEKIMIFGDYDADGVCGSSIIYKALKSLNFDVVVYLPDREKEGYGLNGLAIEYAKSLDCKLIITVDCGISNRTEVEQAKSLGIDVIVTDHHDVPEKAPDALAIIHPGWDKNYPFAGLSGGGVAFKFVSGLVSDKRFNVTEPEKDKLLKWLLDLVAISTVADMVPLVDENRVLVYYGLRVLKKTKNIGLQKLLLTAQRDPAKMDETSIGFIIAPRINAAGRMDHASKAFELLTTEDVVEAVELSADLEKNNIQRQQDIEIMVDKALLTLGKIITAPAAVMVAEGWPTGLIGLVASKLVEKYNRPSLVITMQDDKAVGSGRSPADFNLIANLHKLKQFFDRYGGHPGAAGFSMAKDKVNDFVKAFEAAVINERSGDVKKAELNIDASINGIDLRDESGICLANDLQKFAPFGMGNPEPVLALLGARISGTRLVGAAGKHLQLQVVHDGEPIKAIAFGYGKYEQELQPGQFIDLAVKVGINEWNGRCEVQCTVVDIKSK